MVPTGVEGGQSLAQTDPLSVPLRELYEGRPFPEGETVEYGQQYVVVVIGWVT